MKEKLQQRRQKNQPMENSGQAMKENVNYGVQNSQNMMTKDPAVLENMEMAPDRKNSNEFEDRPKQDKIEENIGYSENEIEKAQKKQSKIGKVLSEKSIKKIIIVVLVMMFIIPLFSIDLYRDPENAWDYLLINEDNLLNANPTVITTASITALIQSKINTFSNQDSFIIQYTTPFNELPYLNNVDLSVLRDEDLLSSSQTINTAAIMANRPGLTLRTSSKSSDLTSLNAILNQNSYNRKLAAFSMGKTLFICLILLILMQLFSQSIDTLLVEPIENMMDKLMLMAKDPEAAAK